MKTETTTLSVKEEEVLELSITSLSAAAQKEVEGAIIIAKKFPRNEDQTFARLMKACDRTSFAEKASYAFPRKDRQGNKIIVSGATVNLAREAARIWGNLEYGLLIIRDDENTRQIRGWAWDKETNTKIFAEDQFEKLIFRIGKGYIKPDERDLRELTNRRGAILVRNCLLHLLPCDLIEDARERAKQTIEHGTKQDPDEARKRIILAFSQIGVTPEMIEQKIGHPIAQCSPEEITELRQIWQAINEGTAIWKDYLVEESIAVPTTNGKIPFKKVVSSENGIFKENLITAILNKVNQFCEGDIEQINAFLASSVPVEPPPNRENLSQFEIEVLRKIYEKVKKAEK